MKNNTDNNKENSKEQVKPERFSYALYKVGEGLLDEDKNPCSELKVFERTFRINNYNEGSMNTIDFIDAARDVVELIKRDLVYKTADYSRIYDGPEYELGAFSDEFGNSKLKKAYIDLHPEECVVLTFKEIENNAIKEDAVVRGRVDHIAKPRHYAKEQSTAFDKQIKPFEVYFRFVIKDGDKVKFEEMFDASVYPSIVRDRIDFSNYDRPYDAEALQHLSINDYVMHELNKNRPNLNIEIMRAIRAVCCPQKVEYQDVEILSKDHIGELVKERRKIVSGDYSKPDEDYYTFEEYGDKIYDFPLRSQIGQLADAYGSMRHDPESKATMRQLTREYFTDNFVLRSNNNNGKQSATR